MWKNIWDKKGLNFSENLTLKNLISIDGFDNSGKEVLNEESWMEYVRYICSVVNINSKKSILEIGCGSGAFLKVLEDIADENTKLYGFDYSSNLINIAKTVIKNCNFCCDEAINIDTIFNTSFDLIFCNSAFHYFNDKEYAYSVIKKYYSILSKGGSLAFLDINDEAKMDIYYKVRFAEIGEEEYKKKYEGLNQLFFSKEEIFNILVKLGFEKIIIEDQNISGYSNNQYRFNAFALKKI